MRTLRIWRQHGSLDPTPEHLQSVLDIIVVPYAPGEPNLDLGRSEVGFTYLIHVLEEAPLWRSPAPYLQSSELYHGVGHCQLILQNLVPRDRAGLERLPLGMAPKVVGRDVKIITVTFPEFRRVLCYTNELPHPHLQCRPFLV
ncbi:MAG: hypothetical protein R6X31_15330 [Anaerolineae bacterium]